MSSTAVNDSITSALQQWSQGQQQGAVDIIRPQAEAGERAPVLLIAWFLSQMGQPFWTEGLTWARRAIELGIPQVATYYFGNLIGDPSFRSQTPELLRAAISAGWSIDPLPNAPGTMQQGDPATATALVEAAAVPRPYPDAWQGLLSQAEADFGTLRDSARDIAQRRDDAVREIEASQAAVAETQAEVEQRAHSLLDLIERVTNAQTTSYFEEEATRYGEEAKWLWRGGLGVVVVAALVALMPLAIYYYQRAKGHAPWLAGKELVGVHTAFVISLGAVAGVLLARARSRDRSRQRNRDLAVALQTMFVYSEQIADLAERQGFIREMGRAVLEAFLRLDPPVDSDRSLLSAIRGH